MPYLHTSVLSFSFCVKFCDFLFPPKKQSCPPSLSSGKDIFKISHPPQTDHCNTSSITELVLQVFIACKTIQLGNDCIQHFIILYVLCLCAESIMFKTMPVYAHTFVAPSLCSTFNGAKWVMKPKATHFPFHPFP